MAAAKAAVAFAKDHEKFVLLGGAMGKTALDVEGVKSLATLPSLDELRAKLLGLLAAPATKLAQLANAPAAKVARVVGGLCRQRRSLTRLFTNTTFEPYRRSKTWPISKRSSTNCRA